MTAVDSRDGTRIAFERSGSGPALVLVDGAMCHRAAGPMRPLAEVLAPDFTVYAYDRRGRGESGDTGPYAVEREVEDLDALIAEAGGTARVCAFSSGAALALRAAASGLSIAGLVLWEPPFTTGATPSPARAEYSTRLAELLAADRRGDAVALFLSIVGMPEEMIAGMRGAPGWGEMEAIAPTLAYDDAQLGDGRVPHALAAATTVPTLVLDGSGSPDEMRQAAKETADALPEGAHRTLAGQTHDVAPDVLAPVLKEFLG